MGHIGKLRSRIGMGPDRAELPNRTGPYPNRYIVHEGKQYLGRLPK